MRVTDALVTGKLNMESAGSSFVGHCARTSTTIGGWLSLANTATADLAGCWIFSSGAYGAWINSTSASALVAEDTVFVGATNGIRNATTGTVALRGGCYVYGTTAVMNLSSGTVTIRGGNEVYGATTGIDNDSTGSLQMQGGGYVYGGTTGVINFGKGELILQGIEAVAGTSAVQFHDVPINTSRLDGCVLNGTTSDVLVDTDSLTCVLASMAGNTMLGGKINLAGTARLLKHPGTIKYAGGTRDAYATLAGANSAAVSGDTVDIASGTWTESGIIPVDGVLYRGQGNGGDKPAAFPAGTTLTHASASILAIGAVDVAFEKIRFSETAGAQPVIAHAIAGHTVKYTDCSFTLAAGVNAYTTSGAGGGILTFDRCYFGVVANSTGIYIGTSGGLTVNCTRCIFSAASVYSPTTAAIVVLDRCSFITANVNIASSSALTVNQCKFTTTSNAVYCNCSGIVLIFNTSVTASAGYAINFPAAPNAASRIEDCALSGTSGDVFVGNGINVSLASFAGNATMGAKIVGGNATSYLKHGGKVKSVGGSVDGYAALGMACASAVAGDTVLVEGGSWATPAAPGLVLASGITVQGRSRARTTITAGAGAPIITLAAAQVVTFESLALVGRIVYPAAANASTSVDLDGVDLLGTVVFTDLMGASILRVYDHSRLIGDNSDATYKSPIYIGDLEPLIYLYDSHLKGAVGGNAAAVYYNVADPNLRISHCTLINSTAGNGTAALLGAVGLAATNFTSHHSSWGVTPIAAPFTNFIVDGKNFDTYDTATDY